MNMPYRFRLGAFWLQVDKKSKHGFGWGAKEDATPFNISELPEWEARMKEYYGTVNGEPVVKLVVIK